MMKGKNDRDISWCLKIIIVLSVIFMILTGCRGKAVPTQGVDRAKVDELVATISIWDYSSFDSTNSEGESYDVTVDNELVETELLLEEKYGRNTYMLSCTYHYGWFDEILELPLVFEYQYIDSATGYDWVGYVDEDYAKRTVELSDGILGEWTDSSWESPFFAKAKFSERQGNSCKCVFLSFTYNGSRYINDIKQYCGKVSLDYELSHHTNKIEKVLLIFDSDEGTFEGWEGDNFIMQAWNTHSGYVTSHRDLVFYK